MALYAEFPGDSTALRIDTVLDGLSPYTICCWVNFGSLASERVIFDTTGAWHADRVSILTTGAVRIRAEVASDGTDVDSSSGVIVAGTWHHLAVVRKSSTDVTVYIDGAAVASNTNDISTRTAWSGSLQTYFLARNVYVSQLAYYVADIKVFTQELSVGELTREARYSRPAKRFAAHYVLRDSITQSKGSSSTLSYIYDPSPAYADDPPLRRMPPGPIYWPPDAGGGSGDISGTATFTLSGSGALGGDGALAGSTATTTTGSGDLKGSGALGGATSIIFAGSATGDLTGALAGTSTLTVTGTGELRGDGALVGTTTIAFAGSATTTSDSALVGISTLTFTGTGELLGSGELAGSSSVVFTGTGSIFDTGAGAVSGTATMAFAGTGTMLGQVLSVQTVGTFGPISIAAGSEWYITVSGPALDAPKVRVSIS